MPNSWGETGTARRPMVRGPAGTAGWPATPPVSSHPLFLEDPPDGLEIVLHKLRPGGLLHRRRGHEEKVDRIFEQILVPPEQLSHPALGSIPRAGIPDLPRGDTTHPGIRQGIREAAEDEILTLVSVHFFIED